MTDDALGSPLEGLRGHGTVKICHRCMRPPRGSQEDAMKIELELTEKEVMALKSDMIIKKQMVSTGFIEATVQDSICMKVLRGAKEVIDADQVAVSIMEGE